MSHDQKGYVPSFNEEYPKLSSFLKTMEQKHPGVNFKSKNIYLIRSEDRDGNITDEKYGLNLMTDIGFDLWYIGSNGDVRLRLFTGGDNLHPASYGEQSIDASPYTYLVDGTFNGSYDGYRAIYDSTTGIISEKRKMGYVVFDYNLSGITEDKVITKIQILHSHRSASSGNHELHPGTSVTIYDGGGTETFFTKHINEKVTIYVFWTASMHENVLINAPSNNIYGVIRPSVILPATYPFTGMNVNVYKYYGNALSNAYRTTTSNSGYSSQMTGWTDDRLLTSISPNSNHIRELTRLQTTEIMFKDYRKYVSRTLLSNSGSSGGAYGGPIPTSDSMLIMTPDKMDTAEELTCDEVYTNSTIDSSLSNSFGWKHYNPTSNQGILPVTDFSITPNGVKGYNYLTHDWDIDVGFFDNPAAYYDNSFNLNCYVYLDEISNPVYVYTNMNTSLQITKFEKFDGTTPNGDFYATDKYWDYNDWHNNPIQDPSNVPQSLSQKRYYIKTSGYTGSLVPTYAQDCHSLNVGTTHVVADMPSASGLNNDYSYRAITSQAKSWILIQDHLLFMNSSNDVDSSVQLNGDANSSRIDPHTVRYGFDQYVVVAPRGTYIPTNIRIYDVDDISNPVDISLGFTNVDKVGHYSSSTIVDELGTITGAFVVVHNEYDKVAYVINVLTQKSTKLEDVSMCTAIEGTSYCIYKVPNSSPQQFVVCDMSNDNTTLQTFTLPNATFTNLQLIIGFGDYVYIQDYSNSVTSTFFYTISANVVEQLSDFTLGGFGEPLSTLTVYNNTGADNLRPDLYKIPYVVHKDCIIWRSYNPDYDGYQGRYIKYTEPKKTHDLYKYSIQYYDRQLDVGDYAINNYGNTRFGADANIVQTSDGKHLLLIYPWSNFLRGDDRIAQCKMESNAYQQRFPITDLGYVLDHSGEEYNQCYEHSPEWNPSTEGNNNINYNGMAYWNNGIIVFARTKDDGTRLDTIWSPLDLYLPHRVTGSTYTIQFYNNPKTLNGKQISLYLSNRNNISPYYGAPATIGSTNIDGTDIGGQCWLKQSPLYDYTIYMDRRFYKQRISNAVYRKDSHVISLNAGDTISVSITGTDQNLTFKWYIFGLSSRYSNDPLHTTFWSGLMAQANGNGAAVQIPSGEPSSPNVIIAIECQEDHYLEPWELSDVTITITRAT